jgi:hypothetical protein
MIYKNFKNNLSKFDFNDMKPYKDAMNGTSGVTHTDIKRIREGKLGGAFFVTYSNCSSLGKDAIRLHIQQLDLLKLLFRKHSANMEMVTTVDGSF